MRLERIKDAAARQGVKPVTMYWRARQGLATTPIKIGKRASAIPASETDALIAARVAGLSDDQIRALVTSLHAERANAVERLAA